MKVWIDIDEIWPVYSVSEEYNEFAEHEMDIPEELALEVMAASEAFEEAQYKLKVLMYERTGHSA